MAWRAPGAGDLRDRITIQRRSTVSDGMGGRENVIVTVLANLPAQIVSKRGGEQVQSDRLSGLDPADIFIRYTTAIFDQIGPDCIVVDDRSDKSYAIKWVGCLEEGRKRWILLACRAGEVSLG